MAECPALAPLLCVPPFPAVCPCSDFCRTDFTVLSCSPPPRRYDEPGRVPRRDYPEVSNALFISRTSSSTLRKLSSRPVSSQDTDPCQLVFWRKSTDTVKVASLPVAVCSPAGTAARWEDVRKDRTAVKDWGKCVSLSRSSWPGGNPPSSQSAAPPPEVPDCTAVRSGPGGDKYPRTRWWRDTRYPTSYLWRILLSPVFTNESIAYGGYKTGYIFKIRFQKSLKIYIKKNMLFWGIYTICIG